MDSSEHNHQHSPNRFGVIPTSVRLNADPEYTGKGVTIAFLDSGFYPHPDLVTPVNRVLAYEDLAGERRDLFTNEQARRSEEHTSELQSRRDLVCRLLLEKKKITSRETESRRA